MPNYISPVGVEIRLDRQDAIVAFDCRDVSTGTIQITSQSWGSAVITLRRSNDGINFHALEYPVTFSASGMSETLDLHAFRYLGAQVTTTGTANTIAVASFFGYSE